MFSIREIEPNDLPLVYEFTLKLLRHHVGQNGQSALTQPELVQLFQDGFLNGLLLVRTPIAEQNSNREQTGSNRSECVGFMIFHADLSLLRGGQGICLDQFYIEPECRHLGLGRRMMSVLCKRVLDSKGKYIKLIYQDGLGLDQVYGNMGFINHSKGDVGVHLFESYGKAKLEEFVHRVDETNKEANSLSSKHVHLMVVPFSKTSTDQTGILPMWSALSDQEPEDVLTNNPMLPGARLIIVAEDGRCTTSTEPSTPNTGLLPRFHSRLCMFIEQTCICCWLGPMVNFADFVGDMTILEPGMFRKRIQNWIQNVPQTSGAAWEVPTQACTTTDPMRSSTSLASKLRELNVPDDTASEGWNIAYLDVPGMQKLAEFTTNDECHK